MDTGAVFWVNSRRRKKCSPRRRKELEAASDGKKSCSLGGFRLPRRPPDRSRRPPFFSFRPRCCQEQVLEGRKVPSCPAACSRARLFERSVRPSGPTLAFVRPVGFIGWHGRAKLCRGATCNHGRARTSSTVPPIAAGQGGRALDNLWYGASYASLSAISLIMSMQRVA